MQMQQQQAQLQQQQANAQAGQHGHYPNMHNLTVLQQLQQQQQAQLAQMQSQGGPGGAAHPHDTRSKKGGPLIPQSTQASQSAVVQSAMQAAGAHMLPQAMPHSQPTNHPMSILPGSGPMIQGGQHLVMGHMSQVVRPDALAAVKAAAHQRATEAAGSTGGPGTSPFTMV